MKATKLKIGNTEKILAAADENGKCLATVSYNDLLDKPDSPFTAIYPVGTIYETTNSAFDTAAKLQAQFGFGTWEAWGGGRVLVGLSSSETEFDTILETGGAKTHTLTTDQIPSHGHNRKGWRNVGSGSIQCASREQITGDGNSYGVENTGGGQAHNNLQPYIVVYRYRRIA